MATKIAAVGEMLWTDEQKGFTFTWIVPDEFEVNPVVVVEVDIYEDGKPEAIVHCGLFRTIYRGRGCHFVWSGPPRGDSDQSSDVPPPVLHLTFDPDDLLRPLATTAR